MIRIQKISKVVLLFLTVTLAFSCSDDDTEVPFEVIGDTYVILREAEEDLSFAMAYFAYGNQPMSEAKVTSPEGEVLVLETISPNQNIYAIEPTLNDFSDMPGVEGAYLFEVVNEGIPHESTDNATYDFIDIPYIDTTYFDDYREVLSVEWTPDGTVENYMVKMTEVDGELVFASRLLGGSVPQYEIEQNVGSWFKYIEADKEYVVELHGILYEPTATNDDYLYNIQEIAIGTKLAKWGE